MQIKEYNEILDILTKTGSNVYLWGCSVVTKRTIQQLRNLKVQINAIIDNNQETNIYMNIPVFTPDYLLYLHNTIIIIQGNHCLSIYKQLQQYDLLNVRVIFDQNNGGDQLVQLVNKKKLYFMLNDFLPDISLNDIFSSEDYNIELRSYTHISKISSGGKILINFNSIYNHYIDNLALQDIFTNYLIKYINQKIHAKFLYIGCGEDYKEGYLHSDLRSLNHVDIVCNAWELSKNIKGLKKLYTRHMLEHLTQKEAYLALQDWYESLGIGGELEIIVPNFDLRAKQWLESKWEHEEDRTHEEIWSVAGCWGWQRECDPLEENYNNIYWDVHKSGYNEKRITMLLTQVGFKNIVTKVDERNNLIAIAYKK